MKRVLSIKILLYYKPATGLDSPQYKKGRETHKEHEGRDRLSITGVVITHDIGTGYEVSDRVI